MFNTNCSRARILVTGATGFLGQHVVSRLLKGGHACVVAIRGAEDVRWDRLAQVLSRSQQDATALRATGQLDAIECDLPDRIESVPRGSICQVVHVAASTRFSTSADGNPARTNVEGTRRILEWAAGHDVKRLHLVSTAYVGGRTCRLVRETAAPIAPAPRNDYELSKLRAEQLAVEWSHAADRVLTIHRPSIIVGNYADGRTCKYDGFYLPIRATEFLARPHADATVHQPAHLKLRIEGCARAKQNIVPVDWVAQLVCGIIGRHDLQGDVFNLVNPHPPTNEQIKTIVQRYFRVTGSEFIEPAEFTKLRLSTPERAFHEAGRSIREYMADDIEFLRDNTARAEQVIGVRFPLVDESVIVRLIDYAVKNRFGRNTAKRSITECSEYFERFLPAHIERSNVVRITAMDIVVRFVVGQTDDYVCKFRRGRLTDVRRNCRVTREDVAYHTTHSAFWRAVSGTAEPQELFLTGEADIDGDVERALKLATILSAFSREYPCDQDTLRRDAAKRRSA